MKKLLLTLVACGIGVLVGCGVSNTPSPAKAETSQQPTLTVVDSGGQLEKGDNTYYQILKDNETDVEYIYIENTSRGSVAITPRVDRDFSYQGSVHTMIPVVKK